MALLRTALVLAAVGLVGCGGSETSAKGGGTAPVEPTDPEAQITDQIEFDFSLAHDRDMFLATDLAFRASIGPYAVYDVTGPEPRLEGPWVRYSADVGYAMLCAASNYFTGGAADAEPVTLSLVAGADLLFVDTVMAPMMTGLCTNPTDDYGDDIPDDSTSGDDPSSQGPVTPKLAKLSIDIQPAPAVGSTMLLRRTALSVDKPGHNDSHVVPKICCDNDDCGLTKPDPSGGSPL